MPNNDLEQQVWAFLLLLEKDADTSSPRVRPVPRHLLERAKALVEGVEVDLAAPLDAADD